MRFEFDAEVWRWEARQDSSWFFLSLPAEASEDIRELPRPPRGFGAVRVVVRIGGSSWQTSIFPDSASGAYALPLKQAVRDAEGLELGDVVHVVIEIAH